MSLKKAQKIANEVDNELGISFAAYQNSDLEFLKKKLEEFLDLEIDTEDLDDADDFALDDDENLDDRDECTDDEGMPF